ncbi:putative disease resistance protein RGA3 [Syzygium oleosum]|uniref:putative disease resistance protein RGA3 n=1 Tax=Syzygium oleosum TaxID=219896 RepID=UPI0024BB296C|nr:putative disease resistance protein RGA3 [Syzygium oleosum]
MHDLMHDLAQKVAGGECKIVNFKGGDNDRGIRHALFILEIFSEEKMVSLLKTSKLRTFLYLGGEYSILKLIRCGNLKTFPRDLRKLVNLRHLSIDGCDSLSHLPPLSELPSLRTLILKDLDALEFLQQTSDPEQSNTTRPFFPSLEKLCLHSCSNLKGWWGRRDMEPSMLETLLRLASNLESMGLHFCNLKSFWDFVELPEWIQHLTTLQSLEISYCEIMESLPEWIGNLSLLEKLILYHCPKLERLPWQMRNLTQLKELRIFHCRALKERCNGQCSLEAESPFRLVGCLLMLIPRSVHTALKVAKECRQRSMPPTLLGLFCLPYSVLDALQVVVCYELRMQQLVNRS